MVPILKECIYIYIYVGQKSMQIFLKHENMRLSNGWIYNEEHYGISVMPLQTLLPGFLHY